MERRSVVYVVVDGMGSDAFEQAVASGQAPAFAFLRARGTYVRDSVAVFPTITPAATASLLTGATVAEHAIPGMCWYDRGAERFVNYGQSPRAALAEGVSQVVEDVLFNLNERHLSREVSTMHETLDALGIVTASINFMVFRGPYRHRLEPNLIQRIVVGDAIPDAVHGPKEHYFADVIAGPADAGDDKAGPLDKRLRATDGWAAHVTRDLLERRAADMILFYLHENDHWSHRKGPSSQVENIIKADEHLGYVLEARGSWEQTVEEVGFVVTADHAQTPVADDADHVLKLQDILNDFRQVEPAKGEEPFGDAEVASAGNGRVGFVYLHTDRREELVAPVVRALMECPGTDQVMWREGERYAVASGRGEIRFWDGNGNGVIDERDNKWSFEGELAAIGGIVEENRLRTPEYPLAFWRIEQALDLDRVGDIVVTPKLTYEFADLGGGDHRGGGDHASLHAQDSLVPFVSTLSDPPLRPSTVDVVPHIVEHFRRQS